MLQSTTMITVSEVTYNRAIIAGHKYRTFVDEMLAKMKVYEISGSKPYVSIEGYGLEAEHFLQANEPELYRKKSDELMKAFEKEQREKEQDKLTEQDKLAEMEKANESF